MAYGITSSSQLIDIAAISAGCNAMRTAANDFVVCGNEVNVASTMCSSKVLAVDDFSMEPVLAALGDSIKEVESIIANYADSIESVAKQVYDAQLAELQEYNRKMEEARRAAAARASSSNSAR